MHKTGSLLRRKKNNNTVTTTDKKVKQTEKFMIKAVRENWLNPFWAMLLLLHVVENISPAKWNLL